VETIDYLAGRLGALEERPQPSAESPLDISHIEEAVTALMERLGRLEQLDARVDELAAAAASPSHPDPSPVAELRDELEARLAELGRKLEERLADGPAGPSEASEGVEGELERTRMAIERLSLHLGEHDRALAEMRGSRAMAQRLEELAARLDGMAAGALPASAAAPGGESSSSARGSLEPDIEMRAIMRRLEDLEEAASVGREKLMNRLERVASSIDWRLQRLEASDLAPEEGKS
jgi:hypothetical protein